MEKIDIKSLNYEELIEFMTEMGEKPFRGKQIYEWLHKKAAMSFGEMTNISKALQQKLEGKGIFTSSYTFEIM